MKYLLILFLFINLKVYSQSDDKLKNEAMQFSLEVVKTFFQKNEQFYLKKVSDTLISLNDKVYFKKKIKDRLDRIFKDAVRDKSKTFQDYQSSYKYEVFSIQEFEKKFKFKLSKNSKLSNLDFCFFGGIIKDSKKDSENFIWDDCFSFVVRKEKGKWFVKGFGE